MRWPLRNQILLPFVALTLVTLVVMSAINAWLATRRIQNELERRLSEAAQTLENTNIPLNDVVLRQTRGLSGADFVVVSATNEFFQSNSVVKELPESFDVQSSASLNIVRKVQANGAIYFYAAVNLDRRKFGGGESTLHIFYPEQSWRIARDEAIFPPVVVGGVALLLLIFVSIAVASRVTTPIARLQSQVEQIANGNYEPLDVPASDDEIRVLATAINQMAETLSKYEEQVRRGERLRTLGQLGGAVAHQMRNAVTGCRMALDLHVRDCEFGEQNEDLEVAIRQLSLMEKYLRRFLATTREPDEEMSEVDAVAIVKNVVSLVRPSAIHLNTALEFETSAADIRLVGNSDSLEQMLINLTLNAIEATPAEQGQVVVSVICHGTEVTFEVKDNGPGPPVEILDSIFEPLVTGKPDGAGLGLAIVRDIAEQHGGKVSWSRDGGWTKFQCVVSVSGDQT